MSADSMKHFLAGAVVMALVCSIALNLFMYSRGQFGYNNQQQAMMDALVSDIEESN